jgi:putative nucleotide binding protein
MRMTSERPPRREEIAWVLDYLPYGHVSDSMGRYQKRPLIQGVGERDFVLMEMTPKERAVPEIGEKAILVGKDRPIIDRVNRRIGYEELSSGAKVELPYALQKIVLDRKEFYLRFFNEAGPLTTRMHALELLPGIGKKLMWAVLNERKKGPFKSFEELTERVKGVYNPEKLIAKRIEDEIADDRIKYRIFTADPRRR